MAEYQMTLSFGSSVIHIPVLPEKLTVKSPGKNETATVLELGEVSLLRRRGLRQVSWESHFPAHDAPYVSAWEGLSPVGYVRDIEHWRDTRESGRLSITGTDLKEVQAKTNVRCGWDREKIRKHLQSVRDFEQKYRVPILVGEFSVVRWAPKEDAERYLADLVELFEEFGWSWCYHGLRDYHGWSLLHTETYGDLTPAKEETRRSRIIRAGLRKNLE